MGDIVDRAQAREQEIREEAIERQRRLARLAPARVDCEDCGEKIPATRRRAVPGCSRCVDCQVEFERRNKGGRT